MTATLDRPTQVIDRALKSVNDFETFGRSIANAALQEARKQAKQNNGNQSPQINMQFSVSLHVQADQNDDAVQVWLDTPSGRVSTHIYGNSGGNGSSSASY